MWVLDLVWYGFVRVCFVDVGFRVGFGWIADCGLLVVFGVGCSLIQVLCLGFGLFLLVVWGCCCLCLGFGVGLSVALFVR